MDIFHKFSTVLHDFKQFYDNDFSDEYTEIWVKVLIGLGNLVLIHQNKKLMKCIKLEDTGVQNSVENNEKVVYIYISCGLGILKHDSL